jgi:acetyltransferase-like isoleucine patch superfamily enzyme
LGEHARIEATHGHVHLGSECVLGERARIEAAHGEVRIGPRTVLGERSTIVALCGVTIGADCALGDYALVLDAGPSYDDVEAPIRVQPPRAAAVRLGDRVRLGPHATVLAGATLDDDAVVEAGQTRARESSP